MGQCSIGLSCISLISELTEWLLDGSYRCYMSLSSSWEALGKGIFYFLVGSYSFRPVEGKGVPKRKYFHSLFEDLIFVLFMYSIYSFRPVEGKTVPERKYFHGLFEVLS